VTVVRPVLIQVVIVASIGFVMMVVSVLMAEHSHVRDEGLIPDVRRLVLAYLLVAEVHLLLGVAIVNMRH
jgi:hypothetical protein